MIIFFYSVSDILLCFFILDSYPASDLWKIWVVGALLPLLSEIYGSWNTRSKAKSSKSYN